MAFSQNRIRRCGSCGRVKPSGPDEEKVAEPVEPGDQATRNPGSDRTSATTSAQRACRPTARRVTLRLASCRRGMRKDPVGEEGIERVDFLFESANIFRPNRSNFIFGRVHRGDFGADVDQLFLDRFQEGVDPGRQGLRPCQTEKRTELVDRSGRLNPKMVFPDPRTGKKGCFSQVSPAGIDAYFSGTGRAIFGRWVGVGTHDAARACCLINVVPVPSCSG